MKRLLIVGASVLQLPAILRAKELGYYVGVADYNPQAVGIQYADDFYNVSTIDIGGIVAAAKQFKPDGIITLATDMPMRAIAAACTELGLPGITLDTAMKSTDKGEMIKAFEAHGVEHPWFFICDEKCSFDEIKPNISFPCIVKPTDNAGSRGVVLVENEAQLDEAYVYSSEQSRGGAVIVEEYMKGNEVSVEIVVYRGCVHVLAVTDKITTGAPHFVEMGHTQPSRLGTENVNKIMNLATRAVKAVGIENGPAHVEIMLTQNGPKLVELGARMGGDCITTHLVPLSTGINMIDATIRIACGEVPDIEAKFQKGSAIRYIAPPCGVFHSAENLEAAKSVDGVKEIIITKHNGDIITEIHSSVDRTGSVIVQGSSADEAADIAEKAVSMIKIL